MGRAVGDPTLRSGADANLVWRHCTEGHEGIEFDAEHEDAFSRDLVGDLRSAVGTYPTDAPLAALLARLRATSPAFESHWVEARVASTARRARP